MRETQQQVPARTPRTSRERRAHTDRGTASAKAVVAHCATPQPLG